MSDRMGGVPNELSEKRPDRLAPGTMSFKGLTAGELMKFGQFFQNWKPERASFPCWATMITGLMQKNPFIGQKKPGRICGEKSGPLSGTESESGLRAEAICRMIIWILTISSQAYLRKTCRIVLAHNPGQCTARTDLIISGHTHGGQVIIPFMGSPILPVRNKNYSHGIKKSDKNTTVFISKGIGWSICPVRFNCHPEIAILELIPEKI